MFLMRKRTRKPSEKEIKENRVPTKEERTSIMYLVLDETGDTHIGLHAIAAEEDSGWIYI